MYNCFPQRLSLFCKWLHLAMVAERQLSAVRTDSVRPQHRLLRPSSTNENPLDYTLWKMGAWIFFLGNCKYIYFLLYPWICETSWSTYGCVFLIMCCWYESSCRFSLIVDDFTLDLLGCLLECFSSCFFSLTWRQMLVLLNSSDILIRDEDPPLELFWSSPMWWLYSGGGS